MRKRLDQCSRRSSGTQGRLFRDAARVDSAGPFLIYWQINLPLIMLSEREVLTLPVGLVIIQKGSYIQRGLAFAAAFIASAPVLLFYAIFQRKIIAGITTTGMAGQ